MEMTGRPVSYVIRPAKMEDAPGLARLLRGIGYLQAFENETEEASLARIRRHLGLNFADDSHTLLVAARDDGRMLGFTAVHWLAYLILAAPEGYISELFVEVDARGQGLGGRLLQAVEVEARRRGCGRLSLLNMRERESYLRGFYIKHGWVERPEAANMVYWLR
jgi:GNAT superfamily N-acetyltransferase